MKLSIRRKLSQASFLAVTALSLTIAGNAFASENMSEIDSNAVSQEDLYAPGILDEIFTEEQLDSEYTPLDGEYSTLQDRDGRRRRGDRNRRNRWDGDEDRDNRWGRGDRGRRGRGRQVMACYARNWRGQTYVAYNRRNARLAQRQAVRYCEQVSFRRCQPLGCRREWVN